MKVLLVKPPYNVEYKTFNPSLPLGLCYIASILEQNNIDVKIVDSVIEDYKNIEHVEGDIYRVGLNWKSIEKIISKENPDIVGITCSFTIQFNNASKIANIVKAVNPEIKVAMGGIEPSARPMEVLENKNIDYAFIGESEYSFLNFVKGEKLSRIDGIAFRKENKVIIRPQTQWIKNIDELPLPARHLLPIEKYFKAGGRAFHVSKSRRGLSVITSRGCPFNCRFCSIHSIWGYSWRPHSPQRVVEEIKHLVDNYGVEEIFFEDDNLILDRKRFVEICKNIKPLKLRWSTPNGIRPDMLDLELLKIMKESGCYSLNMAVEHGDKHMLHDVMKKNLNLERVKENIKYCKQLRIHTFGYFVIGMPGETKETIKKAVQFAKESSLDEIGVAIATPYPGSDLYRECKEKGYIRNIDYSKLFVDKAVISTPWLSTSELERAKIRFAVEFNKSRMNIIPYLNRIIKNPMLIGRYFKMVIKK